MLLNGVRKIQARVKAGLVNAFIPSADGHQTSPIACFRSAVINDLMHL